jgi:H/ACA ribonucleoprotein complex subunit 4
MTGEEIEQNVKGVAFSMKRIIMKPGTYPKAWRSNDDNIASKHYPKTNLE